MPGYFRILVIGMRRTARAANLRLTSILITSLKNQNLYRAHPVVSPSPTNLASSRLSYPTGRGGSFTGRRSSESAIGFGERRQRRENAGLKLWGGVRSPPPVPTIPFAENDLAVSRGGKRRKFKKENEPQGRRL